VIVVPDNLIVARDLAVVRRLAGGKIEHHLVDVAPSPALGRIVAFDDRVAGGVKMLGRVPVRRLVATADMSARAADPEMEPSVAGLEAFLAPERARRHVVNGVQVRAGLRHREARPIALEVGTWGMGEEIVDRRHHLGAFADRPADPLDRT